MEAVSYHHRQAGTLMYWVVAGVFLLNLPIAFVVPHEAWPVIFGVVTATSLVVLVLFGSLSVKLTDISLVVWFGSGLIKRTIPLTAIRSAKVVRNSWMMGWGVRFYPGGWIYNVSGYDAVELEISGKATFRIGTDDPVGLQAAIQTAISNRKV